MGQPPRKPITWQSFPCSPLLPVPGYLSLDWTHGVHTRLGGSERTRSGRMPPALWEERGWGPGPQLASGGGPLWAPLRGLTWFGLWVASLPQGQLRLVSWRLFQTGVPPLTTNLSEPCPKGWVTVIHGPPEYTRGSILNECLLRWLCPGDRTHVCSHAGDWRRQPPLCNIGTDVGLWESLLKPGWIWRDRGCPGQVGGGVGMGSSLDGGASGATSLSHGILWDPTEPFLSSFHSSLTYWVPAELLHLARYSLQSSQFLCGTRKQATEQGNRSDLVWLSCPSSSFYCESSIDL